MTARDDDEAIEELVLESFPYPVAVNLAHARAARQKGEAFHEFQHLLVTTEALLQLVGSALLLDLVSCETTDARRDRLSAVVSDLGALDAPTIGTWTYIVENATKVLDEGNAGFFGRHAEAWQRVRRPLNSLREIRNVGEHPKARPSALEAGNNLDKVRKRLRRVFQDLAFLSDYRLLAIGPARPGIGSQSVHVTSLRGASLPYEGRWLQTSAQLHEEDLVLVSPNLDEYLSLRPFYLARRGQDDADRIWAFRGVAAADNPKPQYRVVDRFSDQRQFLLRPERDAAPSIFLEQVARTPTHHVRGALKLTDAARSELRWDARPPDHVAAAVGAEQLRPLAGGMSLCFEGLRSQQSAKAVVLRGDLDAVPVGSKIVVKVCPAEAGPQGREHFEREYDLLSKTSHPHVTHAHALVRDGDAVYLVLPFVDGVPLARVLQELEAKERPYAEATACRLARQLVEAVAAIHRVGAHGDLKPANLIVDDAENPMSLTVIDLGAGESDELATTSMATAFGTRGYVAPERFVGWDDQPFDGRRADLYAMAVTIYELFQGEMPQLDADREGLWVATLEAPRRWRVLVRWCGQIDPSKRPASAEACLRLLDGEVDAPGEITERVEHRSLVHRVVSEATLWSVGVLSLMGFAAAVARSPHTGRPEYLALPGAAILALLVGAFRGWRRDRGRGKEAPTVMPESEGGGAEAVVLTILVGLTRVAAPFIALTLGFGLLWFASNDPLVASGLSERLASWAHLGIALGFVAVWGALKLLERRWD